MATPHLLALFAGAPVRSPARTRPLRRRPRGPRYNPTMTLSPTALTDSLAQIYGEGRGQVVGVAHGQHGLTDPIAALDAWLEIRGTAPGPVLTSMRQGGPALRPFSGNAVSALVKERALAAGLSNGRISGHSLRAGHATSAALAGIGIDRIAAQTRRRRIDILIERYIRPV
jgi:hypothetical protein